MLLNCLTNAPAAHCIQLCMGHSQTGMYGTMRSMHSAVCMHRAQRHHLSGCTTHTRTHT